MNQNPNGFYPKPKRYVQPNLTVIQGGGSEDKKHNWHRHLTVGNIAAAVVLAGVSGAVAGASAAGTSEQGPAIVKLVDSHSTDTPVYEVTVGDNGGGVWDAVDAFALAEGDSPDAAETSSEIVSDVNAITRSGVSLVPGGDVSGGKTFYVHPVHEITDPSQLTSPNITQDGVSIHVVR